MNAGPAELTSRVYVTGTGVISCAGKNPAELWANAHGGRTGIIEGIGPVQHSSENAALDFSLQAIQQAMSSAGWTQLESDDGLIFATTTGQIPVWDKALIAFLRNEIKRDEFDLIFSQQPLGTLVDMISDRLKFTGRSFITSTACTAATQAIALGAEWISQKRVKRCLVVGTEVLCTLTLEGFKSLQLLSTQSAKPFDADRKGINLSEGSAALCLEGEPSASTVGVPSAATEGVSSEMAEDEAARSNLKSRALAEVSGIGLTTDSFHMTAPEPQGRGCRDAILQALKTSRLQPKDISWIHAHGTGSPHNDSAEGAAIVAVFGEDGPPVSSTKGIHGHSLGASGALETVLCIEAMKKNEILATYGLVNPDSSIKVNVVRENRSTPLHHVLKLTLGFGGANAAVILSAPASGQANRDGQHQAHQNKAGLQ